MTRNKKAAHAALHARGDSCALSLTITCAHVLSATRPVLLVWRDDAGVALACGEGDHRGVDDWGMAHAFHFTGNDPALGIVHTLRPGQSFCRDRVGAPWRAAPDDEGGVVTDL